MSATAAPRGKAAETRRTQRSSHHPRPAMPRAWWVVGGSQLALLVIAGVAVTTSLLDSADLSAAVAGNGISAGVAGQALLVSSILLGLPHGAVDLSRLQGSARHRAAVTVVYLGLACAAAAVWLAAPLPTLLGLLALAVVHFGVSDADLHDDDGPRAVARFDGDAGADDQPTARSRRHRLRRWSLVATLGGAPVLIPLGLHGDAVRDVLDQLTAGHSSVVVHLCRALLPALGLAVVVTAATCAAARRWTPLFDLVVLVGVFLVLTPFVAFAAYFGLWHSWRQTDLLVTQDMARHGVTRRAATARLIRQSLPPVALTLVTMAGVLTVGGLSVLTYLLVAVLCLTVPHTAAGAIAG